MTSRWPFWRISDFDNDARKIVNSEWYLEPTPISHTSGRFISSTDQLHLSSYVGGKLATSENCEFSRWKVRSRDRFDYRVGVVHMSNDCTHVRIWQVRGQGSSANGGVVPGRSPGAVHLRVKGWNSPIQVTIFGINISQLLELAVSHFCSLGELSCGSACANMAASTLLIVGGAQGRLHWCSRGTLLLDFETIPTPLHTPIYNEQS